MILAHRGGGSAHAGSQLYASFLYPGGDRQPLGLFKGETKGVERFCFLVSLLLSVLGKKSSTVSSPTTKATRLGCDAAKKVLPDRNIVIPVVMPARALGFPVKREQSGAPRRTPVPIGPYGRKSRCISVGMLARGMGFPEQGFQLGAPPYLEINSE